MRYWCLVQIETLRWWPAPDGWQWPWSSKPIKAWQDGWQLEQQIVKDFALAKKDWSSGYWNKRSYQQFGSAELPVLVFTKFLQFCSHAQSMNWAKHFRFYSWNIKNTSEKHLCREQISEVWRIAISLTEEIEKMAALCSMIDESV